MQHSVEIRFPADEHAVARWANACDPDALRGLLRAAWQACGRAVSPGDADLLARLQAAVRAAEPDARLVELERSKVRAELAPQLEALQRERDGLVQDLCSQRETGELRMQLQKERLEREHASALAALDGEHRDGLRGALAEVQAELCKAVRLELLDNANGGGGPVVELRRSLDAFTGMVRGPLQKVERYVDRFDGSNSSVKGRAVEDKFLELLQGALPRCELTMTRSTAHAMDISVTGDDRAPVLIDVKSYAKNVPSDEVKKFHDDMRTNGRHGVLVSVDSGVACKEDMQFDVLDNALVAVYVHDAKDDAAKVARALTVVHYVDGVLRRHGGGLHLDEGTRDEITRRLDALGRRMDLLRANHEQATKLLQDFEVDSILQLLSDQVVKKRQTKPAKPRARNAVPAGRPAA